MKSFIEKIKSNKKILIPAAALAAVLLLLSGLAACSLMKTKRSAGETAKAGTSEAAAGAEEGGLTKEEPAYSEDGDARKPSEDDASAKKTAAKDTAGENTAGKKGSGETETAASQKEEADNSGGEEAKEETGTAGNGAGNGSASKAGADAGNTAGGEENASGTGAFVNRASSGALRVEGSHLTDAGGNIVQLRGVSTHGIAWYPQYINQELFKELHDKWGMNVIRLAMYTAESGGYCTGGDKEALKQLIDRGVRYASEAGMYVIIDWHILSDGNPDTYRSQATAFFTEMAKKYASFDNVIYEICNEPNGGTSWAVIKNYAEEVIGAIRAFDADAVVIVGTPNWSQYVNEAAKDPITGYDNIMYALHFYAATHKSDLQNTMVNAVKAGLPVFVTEYGICDASGNGGLDTAEADRWVSIMNQYGISYCNWSLSNKAESASLISSSCGKKSGFSYEDLSASGKWVYTMMTGSAALSGTAEGKSGEAGGGTSGGTSGGTQAGTSADTTAQSEAASSAETASAANTISQEESRIGLSGGDLSLAVQEVNSWESGGEKFTHYVMTVTNVSGKDGTSWETEVSFDGSISLDSCWNGNFTVNGNTLHISSLDYNGTLANGQSTGNIGFIVKGGKVPDTYTQR